MTDQTTPRPAGLNALPDDEVTTAAAVARLATLTAKPRPTEPTPTDRPYQLTGEATTPDTPALLLRIDQDGRNSMSGCMETAGIPATLRQIATTIERQLGSPRADLTAYELRVGPEEDPRPNVIAQYAVATAAALHGEAQYHATYGTLSALKWQSIGTGDDAPVWRLIAVDDEDGTETETDWHIVTVTIPAAYTPAGGDQA